MTKIEAMVEAYIEAIYFTETGDSDQPPADAKLTPLTKCQAYSDCRNFLWAIGEYNPVDGFDDLDPKQLGHDLWLTRNGHGTGFWGRPEIYGEANAVLFTRLSKIIGSHDAEFLDEGEAPK